MAAHLLRDLRPMADEKQRYYSDTDVVREYDRRRFLRGGGRYVGEIELATVRDLLDKLDLKPGDVALDCPTGTGRFLLSFVSSSYRRLRSTFQRPCWSWPDAFLR